MGALEEVEEQGAVPDRGKLLRRPRVAVEGAVLSELVGGYCY